MKKQISLISAFITIFVLMGVGCSHVYNNQPLETQGEALNMNSLEQMLPSELVSCNTDSDCDFIAVDNGCGPDLVANKSEKKQVTSYIDKQNLKPTACTFGIPPLRDKAVVAGCVQNECRRILVDYETADADLVCPNAHSGDGYDSEERCYLNVWNTQKAEGEKKPPMNTCLKAKSGNCLAQYVTSNTKKYSCRFLKGNNRNRCYVAVTDHYIDIGQVDQAEKNCIQADKHADNDHTCWTSIAKLYIEEGDYDDAEALCTSLPIDTHTRRSCLLTVASNLASLGKVASWEVCLEALNMGCMSKFIRNNPEKHSCSEIFDRAYHRPEEVYHRCLRALSYSYRANEQFDLSRAACEKMNKETSTYTQCVKIVEDHRSRPEVYAEFVK